MGSPPANALARRISASTSLGVAAAGLALLGLHEHMFAVARWGLWGVATLTGAAAYGLSRREVLPQVFSRGVAWIVLGPTAFGALASLADGRLPDASATVLALSSAAALWLARPGLQTPEARREFAPIAYRRWFLAGSVSAVVAGLVAAFAAAGQVLWGGARSGAELTALAAVLFATAFGVVRMRAWGVLLGAVTSSLMVGAALFAGSEAYAWMAGLAALPGLVLTGPLVMARLRPEPAPARAAPARARVAAAEDAEPPFQARIAVQAESDRDEVASRAAGARGA